MRDDEVTAAANERHCHGLHGYPSLPSLSIMTGGGWHPGWLPRRACARRAVFPEVAAGRPD